MIYTNLASQKGRFSFQPEESGEVTKLATTSFKGHHLMDLPYSCPSTTSNHGAADQWQQFFATMSSSPSTALVRSPLLRPSPPPPWPVLFTRETLLLLHLLYLIYGLLTLLDPSLHPSSSFAWQHALVVRLGGMVAWMLVVEGEEAEAAARGSEKGQNEGGRWGLVGVYGVGTLGAWWTILARGSGKEGTLWWGEMESWDLLLLGVALPLVTLAPFLLRHCCRCAPQASSSSSFSSSSSSSSSSPSSSFFSFSSSSSLRQFQSFSHQNANTHKTSFPSSRPPPPPPPPPSSKPLPPSRPAPPPIATAGLISSFYFSWLAPLFVKGEKKELEVDRDLFGLLEEDLAERTSARLLLLRVRYPNDTLWASVYRLVWPLYLQQFIWRVLASASVFVAPLALRTLVQEVAAYVSSNSSSTSPSSIPSSMWLAVLGLFLGPFLNAVGDTQAWALGRRMGCMSRSAVGSLIMRKALRLDLLSTGSTPPGELTNLLAVDAESLLLLMVWSHMLTGG
ncbi:hypothetical protein VYU27_010025 [Nannochloropsis oceanica]